MSKSKTPARAIATAATESSTVPDEASEPLLSARMLTRAAFVLSLGIVIARATMMETLRDPMGVSPNSPPVPRGPGPATSLALDLLSWMPALLVLARGCIDSAFKVRLSWAHALMGVLAIWTILSPLWASDQFAAVVSGFHFLSATVFLWSASQLVTSWRRLRLVAGVCAALLLVYGAQALNYRLVERPELQRDWKENRESRLRERGLEPGSFAAEQFEGKILRGELLGFAASPNTFAAMTVLLMVITAGVVIQRLVDRDSPGWAAVPIIGIGIGACILVWADSKTAFMTPLVAAGILASLAIARGWLARRHRFVYITGVIAFIAGCTLFVGHGRYHGTFPIDSLTFRWHYWVGAARVFAEHPFLGVGWDNFGLYYLGARLPLAAEEVRDPHNFIVRFATELGVIGLIILVTWMLRLWWELTKPAIEIEPAHTPVRRSMPTIGIILAVSLGLSVFAGVDFSFMATGGEAGPAYVLLRVIERLFAAVIVFAGLFAATTRSLHEPTVDERPAPWMLYAILAGLGVFFLHNLIDFAIFEIGPMFLFALLAGGVLGIRGSGNVNLAAKARWTSLAGVALVWLVAAIGVAVPVAIAESHASTADELLRKASFSEAAREYENAAETVSYNSDYAMRQADVLMHIAPPDVVRAAFARAIESNPAHSGNHARRAAYEALQPLPDVSRIREDYDTALALDPANIVMRLDYAKTLQALNLPAEAKAQFQSALDFNDQLPAVEIERLPPAKVAEIRETMARLGG